MRSLLAIRKGSLRKKDFDKVWWVLNEGRLLQKRALVENGKLKVANLDVTEQIAPGCRSVHKYFEYAIDAAYALIDEDDDYKFVLPT